MKKFILYVFALGAALFATSCSEDSLSDTSVINDTVNAESDFDRWLEENYRAPFNIRFLYRYEDIETDMNYDLVPANELYSRIIAKMVRFLWLDPYTEVTNEHFMRQYAPRMMQVIGSGAYNPTSGTVTLGTAEGGQKITLYAGNWLERYLTITFDNGVDETDGYSVTLDDIDNINYYYLHTIHHEFAHILHQTKEYPREFNTISAGDYAAQWNSVSDKEAAQMGFVSPYASSANQEDFVEVFSYYLSWSEAQWQARLDLAGPEGAAIINRKLAIVKDYMSSVWNLDLDELRDVMSRRYSEINDLDWSKF